MICKNQFLNNGGLIALVFCLGLSACTSSKSAVLNKTVLKINQTEISTEAFSSRLARALKDYDALYAKDGGNLQRAKEQTVQAFILEVITRDFAKKSNITVDNKELDEEVAKIRSHYPDDNAFRRSLADENLAFETWRNDLEFSLLQKKILKKIVGDLPEDSEQEMKAYYEAEKAQFNRPARIQLRQIVLEKEDDARRILADLNAGGDFAKLAKSFSVAPEGANGGNTGWIEKGTLDFFDQAFKLNVGARSKVVKSPYGYHIFEVVKKEPEAHLSFQDAKAKIRAQLMERKEQKIFSSWLEQEVRKSTVYRNDAIIRAIKVTTRGN